LKQRFQNYYYEAFFLNEILKEIALLYAHGWGDPMSRKKSARYQTELNLYSGNLRRKSIINITKREK